MPPIQKSLLLSDYLLFQLAHLNHNFELWVELTDQLLIETYLAQWAVLLAPAPRQDAFTVEEVSNVAGQRDHLLPRLKVFHAKCALVAPYEENFIKDTLVETENRKLSLLIYLLLLLYYLQARLTFSILCCLLSFKHFLHFLFLFMSQVLQKLLE